MNEDKVCGHEKCFYSPKDNKGTTGRGHFKTESCLSRHHAVLNWHPCCQEEKRCKVGSRIELKKNKLQLHYLKRKRSSKDLNSVPEKVFNCEHLSGCTKVFDSKKGQQDHQRSNHECPYSCELCIRQSSTRQKRIREVEQVEQEDLVAQEEQFFESLITDPPRKLVRHCNSINDSTYVIQLTEEGNLQYLPAKELLRTYSSKLLELCDYIHRSNCTNFHSIVDILKKHSELVDTLLSADSTESAIQTLQNHPDFTHTFLGLGSLPLIADMLPIPTIDACLEMKDRLCISDFGWSAVKETFKLPKNWVFIQLEGIVIQEQTKQNQLPVDTHILFEK